MRVEVSGSVVAIVLNVAQAQWGQLVKRRIVVLVIVRIVRGGKRTSQMVCECC